MHDAELMGTMEPLGDLERQPHHPTEGERLAVTGELRQRLTFQVLHREERQAVVRPAEIVDLHDVGMVNPRDGTGLLLQPPIGVDALRQVSVDNLHRRHARGDGVAAEVNEAHAAPTDEALEGVRPDPLPEVVSSGVRCGRGHGASFSLAL